ncbi:hypothetical protein KGQ71_00450 [Patescibacteria group bacterium]|nr:hypothetical protein [Patescibacteria group bacterium]
MKLIGAAGAAGLAGQLPSPPAEAKERTRKDPNTGDIRLETNYPKEDSQNRQERRENPPGHIRLIVVAMEKGFLRDNLNLGASGEDDILARIEDTISGLIANQLHGLGWRVDTISDTDYKAIRDNPDIGEIMQQDGGRPTQRSTAEMMMRLKRELRGRQDGGLTPEDSQDIAMYPWPDSAAQNQPIKTIVLFVHPTVVKKELRQEIGANIPGVGDGHLQKRTEELQLQLSLGVITVYDPAAPAAPVQTMHVQPIGCIASARLAEQRIDVQGDGDGSLGPLGRILNGGVHTSQENNTSDIDRLYQLIQVAGGSLSREFVTQFTTAPQRR